MPPLATRPATCLYPYERIREHADSHVPDVRPGWQRDGAHHPDHDDRQAPPRGESELGRLYHDGVPGHRGVHSAGSVRLSEVAPANEPDYVGRDGVRA